MDRIEVEALSKFSAKRKAKNKLVWKGRKIKIKRVHLIGKSRLGLNVYSVYYDVKDGVVPSKDAVKGD